MSFSSTRTRRTSAMNGDVEAFCPKAFGQGQPSVRWQTDIKHALATVAIKMAVLGHVRAKMCRAAIQGHLPHQAAFDQRVQAVIDCCHRNVRHLALGPDKHSLGSRVIPFLQQHRVHVFPLPSGTKSAAGQPVIEARIELFIRNHSHGRQHTKPCQRWCQYLE